MDIYMYKNSAEKIVLNKDNYLSSEIHLSGYLRDECDIINPVIEISKAAYSKIWYGAETVDVQSTGQDVMSENPYAVPEHNYIYIPKFKRYYFIDNITSVRKGLWRISMSVDVLMSFRDKINNLTGIVKRSTIATRQNIRDEAAIIPVGYNLETVTSIVKSPIMKNINDTAILNNLFSKYFCGILTVSCSMQFYGELFSDFFYYDYPNDIVARRSACFQSNLHMSNAKFLMNYGVVSATEISDLTIDYFIQDIMNNSDQQNSIISLMMYPFNFSDEPFFKDATTDGEDNEYLIYNAETFNHYRRGCRVDPDNIDTLGYLRFNIGSDNTEKYWGCPISNSFINKLLIGRFDFTEYNIEDWTNFSPYSEYYLYIPFIGYTKLDFNKIAGKYIEVYFLMSWDDGTANCVVVSTPYLTKGRIHNITYGDTGVLVSVNGNKVTSYTSNTENMRSELLLFEQNVQVGVSVPLSASNEAENARKREAYGTQFSASAIVGALSFVAGILTAALAPPSAPFIIGGAATALGGAASIVGGGINYAAQEQQLIDITNATGNLGNVSASLNPNECHIIVYKRKISYPQDYEKIIGKVDMTSRKVGDIPNGYVRYSDIHVDGVDTATSNELDQIERELMNGILIN